MFKQRIVVFSALVLFSFSNILYSSAYKDSEFNAANPATDLSDFYFFRSWEDPTKVVMILNVNSGQHPQDGPALSGFSDKAIYRINVDNNMDGKADDIIYEFKFKNYMSENTIIPGAPFSAIGHPNLNHLGLGGITALDGIGSEGLFFKQYFTVTEYRKGKKRKLFKNKKLFSVPGNLGANVMPDYPRLAAQGIYKDNKRDIRAFAGKRAETMYVDLGAFNSGLAFGRMPPLLSESEDLAGNINPFGNNRFFESNVNSIVIEVPITSLTIDGNSPELTQIPFLGAYGSAHQLASQKDLKAYLNGYYTESDILKKRKLYKQVSRVANPTLNILVTDHEFKQTYNQTPPHDDGQYQNFVKDPVFPQLLSAATGLPTPPAPRVDILSILYKYPGQELDGQDCQNPCADLLHLNTQIPATPALEQNRLGALLSTDPAGLPNGRRPIDDVYDITLRALGGPAFIFSRAGDGVNFNEGIPGAGIMDGSGYGSLEGNQLDVTNNGVVGEFPFLPEPHSAR